MAFSEIPGVKDQRTRSDWPICLMLLLLGLGYALPVPPVWAPGWRSPEIANLFCLTAWMGQAHFVYAFRGQLTAFRAGKPAPPWGTSAWMVAILLSLAVVLTARACHALWEGRAVGPLALSRGASDAVCITYT